jgi:hypothetical protein
MMDPDEVAKREARKARFGITTNDVNDEKKKKRLLAYPTSMGQG